MFFRPKTWAWIAAAALAMLAIVYIDVQSRARAAYLEGEKYMDWNAHPEKKRAFYDEKFERDKAALARELERKKITPDDFNEKLASLQFDRQYALSESSLKYAYQWYKDTYELFSPPESKWVRLAREKAPVALNLWKQELNAQKIPFDDHMFD
jgi:hypothetical protein